MSLSILEVERIASLARLQITPTEIELSCQQLNGIFSLFEALDAVATEGVEPMAHAQDLYLRLRSDEVTHKDEDGAGRDLVQSLAPEAESGLYLVPKVIE